MNKLKLFIWNLIFPVTLFTLVFTSCSGYDDVEIPNQGSVEDNVPVEPNAGKAMSPTEQKQKLEEIALEFMNALPSSDFEGINNDLSTIYNKYGKEYDWENVDNWAENCWEASYHALGTTTETEVYDWGAGKDVVNYIFDNYKSILLASNFVGHFTANNNVWTYSKANDLQFIMPDEGYVVKLTTSGVVKKVYAFNLDDWKYYDHDKNYTDEYPEYVYNEYYDRYQCTIGVPENIVLVFEKGNETVIKTTIKIDLSGITNEQFDIANSNLSATVVTELNNGYKIEVKDCSYAANSKASYVQTITKNGEALLSYAIAGDAYGLPSFNFDEFTTQVGVDGDKFENANVTDAYIKVDVLGKLQVQGKVSDVRRFCEILDDASNYEEDAISYKSLINDANSYLDVFLFYDKSYVKQAYVNLAVFLEEENYWGYGESYKYWTAQPVLCFYDGSSYTSFEVFFNMDDFEKVVDRYEDLMQDYETMIEE